MLIDGDSCDVDGIHIFIAAVLLHVRYDREAIGWCICISAVCMFYSFIFIE